MGKKIITVNNYSRQDLIGDPRDVLARIQADLMKIPKEHMGAVEMETEWGCGDDEWSLNLIYEREETPEEIQADKDARKRRVAEEEAKEREILGRLLKKYGGNA